MVAVNNIECFRIPRTDDIIAVAVGATAGAFVTLVQLSKEMRYSLQDIP